MLRLLTLPHDVQELVESGSLTMGHAKVLLSLSNIDEQQAWAKRAVKERLSVRDLEGLLQPKVKRLRPVTKLKDPNVTNVEEQLKRRLGTNAKLTTGPKGGRISIDYYSAEDLDRILEIILR
jgi:ParB family chromosome partitioning protein